eukprot:g76276.t1
MVELLNQQKPPGQQAPLWTLDFLTLYTSLPQPQLINRLSNYIRVTYHLKHNIDRSTHLYFSVNRTNSYNTPVWCSHPPQSQKAYDLFLDAGTFISFLTFQIENSFIAFGEFVLQQTIGIPMGVNDGVHLADNFLFTYEFDFFLSLPTTLTLTNTATTLALYASPYSIHPLRQSTLSPVSYLNNDTIYARYNTPRSKEYIVTPSSKWKSNTTPHLSPSLTYKSNTTNDLDYTTLTLSPKSSVPNVKPSNSIDTPISDQRWHVIFQPTFSTPQHAIS